MFLCSPRDLREEFGKFGEVKDVHMPKDYHTGKLRGFAFIEFGDKESAATAQEKMDKYVCMHISVVGSACMLICLCH